MDMKNWVISFDPPPVPFRTFDWVAVHQGNDLNLRAASKAELIQAIDEWEQENAGC